MVRLISVLLVLLQSPTLIVVALSTRNSFSQTSSTRIPEAKNTIESDDAILPTLLETLDRRSILQGSFWGTIIPVSTCGLLSILSPLPSHAYTPDPDPLKESLYLICRVQEATCLQERYINKKLPPIKKMKLTLRLVDRSYRLLDQINYISKYMDPNSVVEAVQAGNEAADSLQEAIDFVLYSYKDNYGPVMTLEQKDILIASLTNTREKLFDFVAYLPDQSKLQEARKRVEDENKLNIDEYDPDLANDAGIYNPIELPWTNRKWARRGDHHPEGNYIPDKLGRTIHSQ